MKLNGKFQPRNGSPKTYLQLTRVQSNGVSIGKLQLETETKPAKFSHQKLRITRLFRRITTPFIPLLIFPFTLQRLERKKFHFEKKNPTFCSARVK